MAQWNSTHEASSALSTRPLIDQSWVRRERNDTVLSTYLPNGKPTRPKAIRSPSQLFPPNTRIDGPSNSAPQLHGVHENPAASIGATSTRAFTLGRSLGASSIGDNTRSFSETDLSHPHQESSSPLHITSPSVYVPTGTPSWIQHELNRHSQHDPYSISSPAPQSRYEASIPTVTEFSIDPNILSGSTSIMSGSSSDHAFEMYAMQGTWDSGSRCGKKVMVLNWVRRCGEGVKKIRVGMKGKCQKLLKGMCSVRKGRQERNRLR